MAMTEQQFIALEGNIRKTWDANKTMKKDYLPMFYHMITDPTAQVTDYTIGAAARMTKWEGSVHYDDIVEGYTKQYRPEKSSSGIQITRDMWEDKEYRRMKQHVNSVSKGVFKTLQYESARPFNDAFTSTVKGADGVPLCSASHRSVPGQAVQSNTGTLELNYANVEIEQRLMEDWVDDRGDKMLIEGNKIIAAPYWREQCKKIFGSELEAGTANNDVNTYKDFEWCIHPLLTGKKWFLVNKESMKDGDGLNFFMRRDPRNLERDFNKDKGDFNTELLSWKSVGRWDIGWTNWWFIFGNNL